MSHLVIVGGSSGIGRDIVPHMEGFGHRVSCLPRDEYHPEGNALLFCQRYRGDGDDWAGEIDATLTRTKRIIERIPDTMRSIVLIASVASVSVEEEQPVSYHVCKAGLLAMAKYYAVTLGRNVRVNAIIPALTIKPEARAFYDGRPQLESAYIDHTPAGCMGTVKHIAGLVDFLISDRSTYLTGQTITLDGGIGLRSAWANIRRASPALRDIPVTQRKVNEHLDSTVFERLGSAEGVRREKLTFEIGDK